MDTYREQTQQIVGAKTGTFNLITKHLALLSAFWQWWNDRTTAQRFAAKVLARLYFVRRLATVPVCIASAQIVLVRARSVAARLQTSPFYFPPDCDSLGWSYSTLSKCMSLRLIDQCPVRVRSFLDSPCLN